MEFTWSRLIIGSAASGSAILIAALTSALPILIITLVGLLAIWGMVVFYHPNDFKPLPAYPAWFTKPYLDKNHCYGCGLDPWIMIPGKAIYCFGCWYLRKAIEETPAKYEDFDKEAWDASLKSIEQQVWNSTRYGGGGAGTIVITDGDRFRIPSVVGYTDKGMQVRYNFHYEDSKAIKRRMTTILEEMEQLIITSSISNLQLGDGGYRRIRELKDEYKDLERQLDMARQQERIRTHYAVPNPMIRNRALNEGPDTWML